MENMRPPQLRNRQQLRLAKYLSIAAFVASLAIVAMLWWRLGSSPTTARLALLIPTRTYLLGVPIAAALVTGLWVYALSGLYFRKHSIDNRADIVHFGLLSVVPSYLTFTVLHIAVAYSGSDILREASILTVFALWMSFAFFGALFFWWLLFLAAGVAAYLFWRINRETWDQ